MCSAGAGAETLKRHQAKPATGIVGLWDCLMSDRHMQWATFAISSRVEQADKTCSDACIRCACSEYLSRPFAAPGFLL